MKLTHLGHSTVLVEVGDERLLIDPGAFSTDWHGLSDLTGILVTHQHADHADPVEFPKLIAANPDARVLVERTVFDVVDLPDSVGVLELDAKVDFGATHIETVGGLHAIIHADYPRIGNVGIVLRTEGEPSFFHPGDALEAIPGGLDIVGIPMMAPWAAMKESVEFVRAVGAPQGLYIHQGLLNERGLGLFTKQIGNLAPDTEIVDADAGWTA